MRLSEVLLSSLLLMFLFETPVYAQKKNQCPKLSLKNGRVKIRARGKMAYFKCRKRYTRLGDKFAVCLQTKTWSHPPPLCIYKGCPSLGQLPNMDITESYNGAMLKFQCPVGTKRNGPETITCDGREWSDAAPSCEAGLTLGCDFEKEGLCGWSQDESDNFDWARKSGQTPTMRTGPKGDHTTGAGFYMFIESSSPRKVGDVARLISPAYPPTLKNLCFEFWYHMQGPDDEDAVGSLEVYIKPETASLADIDPEFYLDGNQGSEWHRGVAQIPNQDENFKIVIVGKRKNAFVSDIAIDDLRLFNCSEETTTAVPVTTTSTTTSTATSVTTSTHVTDSVTDAVTDNTTKARTRTEATTTAMQVNNVTTHVTDSTSITTAPKAVTTSVSSEKTSVSTTSRRTATPTTLQTTPTTIIRKTRPPRIVPTHSTPSQKTRITKMADTTTVMTSSVTSSPVFTTTRTTIVTTKQRTTTIAPHKAVTTVYNFSNLATDVREISTNQNPASRKPEPSHVTKEQTDTSTHIGDNVTSSGEDDLPGTMGNEINTPPSSTLNNNKSGVVTTELSNVIPTVIVNIGDSRGEPSTSLMPLVIGITAGILVGMLVIGILAWLWARNQRKKKEREAAEDEMYMISVTAVHITNQLDLHSELNVKTAF